MFQASLPHHDTGGFTSHRKFLSDKEYGEALDCIVKACSDMLLLSPDGQLVFLGKRVPDWWFVGGRIFPGETPVQSCRRLLQRELGLLVEPERFTTVCAQSLAWAMREQLPKEHGTTDAQFVLSLMLREDEMGKVVLDPKEYSESQWARPEDILSGSYHPALKFAVHALLARRKLQALQVAVSEGQDDGRIAELARAFVHASMHSPPSGRSDYQLSARELDYECEVVTTL
ncbi:hypothetical protein AB1Y20_021851 [Prymnesium parvum]|uniref:Nudix hydrolase domain-containing protein n=1 Tax=Prymnesium parvum TaxID=97485 RepID=A0AB34JKZ9_PRYPA